MSPEDAARVADDIEAAAFADLFAAAPAALRAKLGLAIERIGGTTLLIAPGLPTPLFNRAIGLGLHEAADDEVLRAIEARYRRASVASWWLHWNPLAAPAGFDAGLAAAGYTAPPRRRWAKMLRPTDGAPLATTALVIDADDDAGAAMASSAVARAFEMPPFMADWLRALHGRERWRLYALRDDERVVGGACLFVDGATAWLGMGAVLASHRRRGGQRSLLARRIADAGALGAVHAVTETGLAVADEPNPSLANIRAAGFVCVAERLNYASPAVRP